MTTHVMLDLETLGRTPGAVIAAIGAVKFGPAGLGEEFYLRVDLASCERLGLKLDASTVVWWLKQDAEARRELTEAEPRAPILGALDCFARWIGDPEARVWGNGASFDCALLAHAYGLAAARTDPGIVAAAPVVPWKYVNERCYRTLKAQHPEVPLVRGGMRHHALDDARAQALHLLAILAGKDVR